MTDNAFNSCQSPLKLQKKISFTLMLKKFIYRRFTHYMSDNVTVVIFDHIKINNHKSTNKNLTNWRPKNTKNIHRQTHLFIEQTKAYKF